PRGRSSTTSRWAWGYRGSTSGAWGSASTSCSVSHRLTVCTAAAQPYVHERETQMPLGFMDGLQVLRDNSKGNVTGNETALSNSVRVAPGLYDISISVPQQGAGTNAVSTLTAATFPTGGTFLLTVGGKSATLTCGASLTAAVIQAA